MHYDTTPTYVAYDVRVVDYPIQPPDVNWKRIESEGFCEGMKYVLFISKVNYNFRHF